MNHYDNLQRFQEKTRTQNLNFQDLLRKPPRGNTATGQSSIS